MRLSLWVFALFAVTFAEEGVEENVAIESEKVEIESADFVEIKEEQQEVFLKR